MDTATPSTDLELQEVAGCRRHSLLLTVRLSSGMLGGRTVVLEGCSPALRLGGFLQRASAAVGLEANVEMVCGGGKLRGNELPAEGLRRIVSGDTLEMEVLECGGAGGEEGELCSEGAMLIRQSEKLESELESMILPATAEQPAITLARRGLNVEELQRQLEEKILACDTVRKGVRGGCK